MYSSMNPRARLQPVNSIPQDRLLQQVQSIERFVSLCRFIHTFLLAYFFQLVDLAGQSSAKSLITDKLIDLEIAALWRTYPPHENYGLIPNVHKMAILDIAYSLDSEVIYSVSSLILTAPDPSYALPPLLLRVTWSRPLTPNDTSFPLAHSFEPQETTKLTQSVQSHKQNNTQGAADGTLVATDLKSGERIARYSAHFGPLNSISVTISGGRELVLTGGDDGIARVFDLSLDSKEPVAEFDDERDCPVTAVEWSSDGNQCFVGGVDNEIKVCASIFRSLPSPPSVWDVPWLSRSLN